MQERKIVDRRAAIEEVTLALLNERGYENVSMLLVAKRARASNETLYRWYGDKRGLMDAVVGRAIDSMVARICDVLCNHKDDPVASLYAIAPVLIEAVASETLAALDRAAAADHTGQLGAAIIGHGRVVVYPLIEQIIADGQSQGLFHYENSAVATGWFIALVLGDLRTRRTFRYEPPPPSEEVTRLARTAVVAFRKLVS